VEAKVEAIRAAVFKARPIHAWQRSPGVFYPASEKYAIGSPNWRVVGRDIVVRNSRGRRTAHFPPKVRARNSVRNFRFIQAQVPRVAFATAGCVV
jgi:hypothetical protein